MKKILAFLILLYFLAPVFPAPGGPGTSLGGRTITVDPGHGGYDPGAVRGEVYEKNINLQIALELKKMLEARGAKVVLTRDGDYNLAIAGLHKREAHRYDLKKRLEIADLSKASIFVSIHVNCICSRRHGGAEVFFHPWSEKGKILAEFIQSELHTIPGIRKRAAKASQCYVLRNSQIPAALVEVGYLSNGEERKNLLDSQYQLLLAEKICAGIEKFLAAEDNKQKDG